MNFLLKCIFTYNIFSGSFQYDDHCRICHRVGDLLCCETCPAVYHLECVEPPLVDVPQEDWQCNICKAHKASLCTSKHLLYLFV